MQNWQVNSRHGNSIQQNRDPQPPQPAIIGFLRFPLGIK
ncbi:hypothetical protein D082_16390 [Synechocystis sp. PCC 6714]|nr:hypothetical protein D082_16390 [Synechocystis sp. PCC 6714]